MFKHIFWIASYPKSGNTLLRSIIASLFFSENGLFDFHIRTFHDQWWSGQSIYLSFLGVPIKRLYKSKTFDHYQGPNAWIQ